MLMIQSHWGWQQSKDDDDDDSKSMMMMMLGGSGVQPRPRLIMRGIKRGEKFKGSSSYQPTLLLCHCYTTTATTLLLLLVLLLLRRKTFQDCVRKPLILLQHQQCTWDGWKQGVQGLRLKIHIYCTFPSLISTSFLHFQDNWTTHKSLKSNIRCFSFPVEPTHIYT